VQATSNLTPPFAWIPRGQVTTDSLGRAQFTDSSPPPDASFYRTYQVPPLDNRKPRDHLGHENPHYLFAVTAGASLLHGQVPLDFRRCL
jgi:hypothetical protein